MNKDKLKAEKEIENLRHKHKMLEIDSERKAKLEVENSKFNNIMSAHRLKRADVKRSITGRY